MGDLMLWAPALRLDCGADSVRASSAVSRFIGRPLTASSAGWLNRVQVTQDVGHSRLMAVESADQEWPS